MYSLFSSRVGIQDDYLRLRPMQKGLKNSSVYTLYMITVKNNDYYVCIRRLQTPNYNGRVEDNL